MNEKAESKDVGEPMAIKSESRHREVPNMEEFDTLKVGRTCLGPCIWQEALEMKANLSDVPTMQNFVALQKDRWPLLLEAC